MSAAVLHPHIGYYTNARSNRQITFCSLLGEPGFPQFLGRVPSCLEPEQPIPHASGRSATTSSARQCSRRSLTPGAWAKVKTT